MRFAGSPQITNFLHSKLDFGDTAQAGQKANAEQRISAMKADSAVEGARIQGDLIEKMGEMQADATRAQGQSDMFGSIMGGVSSLAGGLGGGLFGGGSSSSNMFKSGGSMPWQNAPSGFSL